MNYRVSKMAALGCLAAGMAFAQAAGPGQARRNPLGSGAIRQRLLNNLDLTADQKAQVKNITQQARTQAQPDQRQLQQTRKALEAAVKSNSAQIPSLSATAGQLQGRLLAVREQAMAQVYALLTPDQKTKLDRMEQRLRQRTGRRGSTGQATGGPAN
jgi:protein CpxP